MIGEGITVGPILLGTVKSGHILTPTSTTRRTIKTTALAVLNSEPVQPAAQP